MFLRIQEIMFELVVATSSEWNRFCFLFMLEVSLLRISLSHHCFQEQTPRDDPLRISFYVPCFPVSFDISWSDERRTLGSISSRRSDFLVSCSTSIFELPFWCLKVLVEVGNAVALCYWCIPEDPWIALVVTSITPCCALLPVFPTGTWVVSLVSCKWQMPKAHGLNR